MTAMGQFDRVKGRIHGPNARRSRVGVHLHACLSEPASRIRPTVSDVIGRSQ